MVAKSPEQQIAMMVDGAQPQCDEPLESAMICSHAGTMAAGLIGAISGLGRGARTSELPNPVLIAVGPTTIYAFKYRPKGFKVKLKKGAEAARWPRNQVRVETGDTGVISQFALIIDESDTYALEVTTAMGAREAYELFIAALRRPSG